MGMSVSRTTDPLRFDVGIGSAGYADVIDSPEVGGSQKSLLPGATTVTQAVDALFPMDENVAGEIMDALVAGNSATLRSPGGFADAARQTARSLRSRNTAAADRAAAEIENLLVDSDFLERCRMALLEK